VLESVESTQTQKGKKKKEKNILKNENKVQIVYIKE
jgi:hypothetical protein